MAMFRKLLGACVALSLAAPAWAVPGVPAALAPPAATLVTVCPVQNSTGAAANNVTLIQTVLTRGGTVNVSACGATPGTVWINATLTLASGNTLAGDRAITVKSTNGTNLPLVTNASYGVAGATATSFTASTNTGTITLTAHGFVAGDYIYVSGATNSGYNGVYQVISVPDANTLTVYLPFAASASPATGTIKVRRADSFIGLSGTFDANAANRASQNTLNDMSTIFQGVYGLRIENAAVNNSMKYSFLLAATAHSSVRNVSIYNTVAPGSDGVHVQGGTTDLLIDGVSGVAGDDLVSVGTGDYSQFQASEGDIYGITIRNLGSNYIISPGAILKFFGKAAFVIDQATIDTVQGPAASGMTFGDDSVYGTGTTINHLTIRNIAIAVPGTGGYQILFKNNSGGAYRSIDISRVNYAVNTGNTAITLGDTTTIGVLNVHDQTWLNTPSGGSALLINSSTIDQLLVSNLFATQAAAGNTIYMPSGKTGSIGSFRAVNVDVVGSARGSGAFFAQGSGTVTTLQLEASKFSFLDKAYTQLNGGTASAPDVVISGVSANQIARLVSFYASAAVHVAATRVTNISSIALRFETAGQTYSVDGAISTDASNDLNTSGAPSLRVNGTFKLDASLETGPLAADCFWNTNSSWSGGSGTSKVGEYCYGVNAGTAVKLYGAP